MDWHGTPRFQNGPPEQKPSFQFKNETEAYKYIIDRGRTPEQLAKLVAGAQMGHAIASVMQLVKNNLWVVLERGPVSKPEVDDLASEASFIRQRPPAISAVRPADLVLTKALESGYQGKADRTRVRAHFALGGTQYRFAVTDPFMHDHLKDGDTKVSEALLCLSLPASAVCGYCYKLVATVITPERSGGAK